MAADAWVDPVFSFEKKAFSLVEPSTVADNRNLVGGMSFGVGFSLFSKSHVRHLS